jgi:hypothetical protein
MTVLGGVGVVAVVGVIGKITDYGMKRRIIPARRRKD